MSPIELTYQWVLPLCRSYLGRHILEIRSSAASLICLADTIQQQCSGHAVLSAFLPTRSQCPLSLGYKGNVVDVSVVALHLMFNCSLHFDIFICIYIYMCV